MQYNIEIDGFELIVVTYNDYSSNDAKIIDLLDPETGESIDTDFKDLILSDFYDEILEQIQDKKIELNFE